MYIYVYYKLLLQLYISNITHLYYFKILIAAGVDYISFNNTLTAVNGSGPILNSAMIIDDEIMEPTEEFGVRLNVLGNARVDVAPSVDFAKVVIGDSDSKRLIMSLELLE